MRRGGLRGSYATLINRKSRATSMARRLRPLLACQCDEALVKPRKNQDGTDEERGEAENSGARGRGALENGARRRSWKFESIGARSSTACFMLSKRRPLQSSMTLCIGMT